MSEYLNRARLEYRRGFMMAYMKIHVLVICAGEEEPGG